MTFKRTHLSAGDEGELLPSVMIGGTTLAIYCAEQWLRSGRVVSAVVSVDKVFQEWAEEQGILCLDSQNALIQHCHTHKVEHLFSIVNPQILSSELINSVQGNCFNYHDSPLPRYAGRNATGWALLNQERDYAVSWHLLEERVDQGDIVVRIPVVITPNETAFSLNLKCYQAARQGFDQLLMALEQKTLVRTSQNLAERSFYAGYRRPQAGGVLRWDRPAAELSALVRALNYGEYYAAPLDLPKILLDNFDAVLVSQLEVLPICSTQPAGTLLLAADDALVIATADFDVRVSGLRALGTGLTLVPEVAHGFAGLQSGQRLPLLTNEQQQALSQLHEEAARHEQFWCERLARFSPSSLSYQVESSPIAPEQSSWAYTPWQTWGIPAPQAANDHDTLLLAFILTLSRLTNESELQLGWVQPPREPLFNGLISATVPFHFRLDEQRTMLENLDLLAEERQRVSHLPAYGKTLYQRHPILHSIVGLAAEPIWPILIAEEAECPVAQQLTLHKEPGGDVFRLGYNPQVLSEAEIERFLGYLQTLKGQFNHCCDRQRCADLILLPLHEQEYLLHGLNPLPQRSQPQRSLAAQINHFAQIAPSATALVFDTEQLSYRQYDERAEQWADHLVSQGVKQGDVIAFCAKKSPATLIGFLATLKLGAIYLPLDPGYPAERLAYILQDASPGLILVDEEGEKRLATALPPGSPMLRLDAPIHGQTAVVRPVQIDLDLQQTAYIIYTSGSTGMPKGVRVSHANLCSLYREQGALLGVSCNSRVLQFSSLSFDASIWEMAMAFGYGGALYFPTERQRLDEQALLDFFHHHQITHATLPPALLSRSKLLCQGLDSLVLTLAGEAPGIELFRQLSQRNNVINGYGPTEGTVCNAAWRCPKDYDGSVVPIGRALGNSQLYLLDARQRLTPFGAIGELYIGGEGVAQGYLNRSELNAQRFIPNPFQRDSDRCLYRTGDLARYLPDGNLLFIGREDHQVKIHGFRIELGDIEAALKQQDGIAECTVILRDSQCGDSRLVAYLVPAAGYCCEVNELRQALESKLPAFMVPSAFVMLAKMPLSPNGKIDRQALPEPDSQAFARESYEPLDGEREQVLASLWGEYFQVERLGRRDNFFALGGDSLLAIRLIGRLGELGWQANIEQLFKTPQLQAFAASLQPTRSFRMTKSGIPERTEKITPEMLPLLSVNQGTIEAICRRVGGDISNIQDIYPLSPLQEGLYFHHALAERGDPYLLVTVLAFPERGLLERYLAALQRVIERHDILRTAFIGQGLEQPVQVVMRHVTLPVTWLDLSAQHGEIYEQLCERYDPRHCSLALTRAPLLQVVAVEDRPNARWLLLHQLHHLVGDHTTLEVIYRELSALMTDTGGKLPPAPAFRTLIERTCQAENQQHQREFFSALLGDMTKPCLPYGLEPLQTANERIKESRQALSSSLNTRLRQQARQRAVSLASLFHVAWGRVLATLSGQPQVVFGSVFFGRAYGDGSAQALGMFINTLPARIDVDTRPVDVAVQQMHQQLTALLGHEQASLVVAQQSSGIAPPAPLFGSLLNYRHNSSATLYSQPLSGFPEITLIDFNETTSYPLVLSVEDYGHQTGLTLQAVTSLCGEQILAYVQQALESVVEALEQNPQTPLQQLSVLPEAEVQALAQQRNQPLLEPQAELCVHQQFERQAALHPNALAVTFGERSLTYGQLNQRANQLAHELIQRGAQPDTPVALCAAPGLEMLVGLLAILKAGAAYLPIDPAYAVERIRLILEDARPTLVLCDAQGQTTLCQQGYEATLLLDEDVEDSPLVQPDPQRRVVPEQLAYIIYTSGSTGVPKGVMVEHRQVSRLFSSVQPWFGFDAKDVWCLFHSFAFDFSVWEIWGALLHGGRLVLVPTEVTRDAAAFYRLVSREGVTVLNQTPSAFRSFIHEQRQRPLALGLRYVIFGGEALDTSMLAGWYEAVDARGPQLVNMYGITETTVHVTYRPLSAEDSRTRQSPVGQRIPDLKLYLLDGQQQPVPDGVVGELYVAGAGLARGYLNRPELTAERFMPDPFNGVAGERMYRTGDLARYRADGELEFIGRNDQQVKLRGFRIELGEIEAVLNWHPAVAQATVQLREDSAGEARLVAYVVAGEAGSAGLSGQLREDVLAHLPEYMVPSAFVLLPALPLTAHGKLDRGALPEPEGEAFARESYAAPEGEVEEQLAQVWSELLGVEKVGRYDDFFALGGHSLRAIQMVERLRTAGWQTDVRQLFRQSRLAEFSKTLCVVDPLQDECVTYGIPSGTTRITPEQLPLVNLTQPAIDLICASVEGGAGNVQDIYPLSPLQDGLLFHHLLQSDSDPYLLASQLAFERRETLESFLAAMRVVVARHDILRTAIVNPISPPLQVVWREATLRVEEIELVPSDGPISEQLRQRFDPRRTRLALDRPPLLRLVVAHDREQQRWVVLQLMHHIIGDHATLDLMMQEVSAIMAGREQDLKPAIPYRQLIAQLVESDNQDEHEAYFQQTLADIHTPSLAFGIEDVQGSGDDVEEYYQPLPEALNRRLREVARKFEVSLASLCHLAWGRVLAAASGQSQVVFGTVLFGRMTAGAGMGLFINTLPLRVGIDQRPLIQGIKAVHQALAELLQHEQASLALAQRCSGVAAPAPLFNSLLNYRHSDATASVFNKTSDFIPGVKWLDATERTNYPIAMAVEDFNDSLALTAQARQPVGAEKLCIYMATVLTAIADALESNQNLALDQLPVVPDPTWLQSIDTHDLDRLLNGPSIMAQFEAQAERTPEAIALRSPQGSLSYRQLNCQANRLAHHLQALGVGADSRVALCVERGLPMVVGLLAILKAGGAYVPLDADYPVERLAYILADAEPLLLIEDAYGSRALAHAMNLPPLPRLCLDTPVWGDAPQTNPRCLATAENLAYMIYTSGSTGQPKGVRVLHRGLLNHTRWQQGAFALSAADRFLQRTSISFDASVWELWTPLTLGASLYLLPGEAMRDLAALPALLVAEQITVLQVVPSMLAGLPELERLGDGALRYLFCGGEPLAGSLVNRLLPLVSEAVVNLYGPTETTIDATFHVFTEPVDEGFQPIGRPIANTRLYVLDEQRQWVPEGAVGELYIGGAGVSGGYHRRAELTAERFVQCRFGAVSDRLYRSGDRVRQLSDGSLQYLGRSDEQVKVRGYRIEPGEIEQCLQALAAVREALVVAHPGEAGAQLVAYVVAEAGNVLDVAALRAELQVNLPDHMVPGLFVELASLPRLPNGKLNRQGLPAPQEQALTAGSYVAPQGELEVTLAGIWGELLGLERVGREDNFFALGGHSLLALKLRNGIRQTFGVTVELSHLFDYGELAAMANHILLLIVTDADDGSESSEDVLGVSDGQK